MPKRNRNVFICFAMLKLLLPVQLCSSSMTTTTETVKGHLHTERRFSRLSRLRWDRSGAIVQIRDKCSQFATLSARVSFGLAGYLFPSLQCI